MPHQPYFHRPEFVHTSDYLDSLAEIVPDPMHADVITEEVEWALTRDLEGQSIGHPDYETRAHVTRGLAAWPGIRIFFWSESEDKIHLLFAELA